MLKPVHTYASINNLVEEETEEPRNPFHHHFTSPLIKPDLSQAIRFSFARLSLRCAGI